MAAEPLRSPIVPETHGTVALYAKTSYAPAEQRKRVIAWDAEGFALVVDQSGGRLVRAADVPDFQIVYVPDAPFLGDPVAMIPARQSETGAVAYAMYRDGTLLGIPDSDLSI